MELTPNNRVLSGEIIIFQNEMFDIFKELVRHSEYPQAANEQQEERPTAQVREKKLGNRYIVSIILEFLRTLLENSIPQ